MRVHPLRATPPSRSFSFSLSFDSVPSQLRAMGPDRFRHARVYRTSIARTCPRGRDEPRGCLDLSPRSWHTFDGRYLIPFARPRCTVILPPSAARRGISDSRGRPRDFADMENAAGARNDARGLSADVPFSAKVGTILPLLAVLSLPERSALGVRGCHFICRATNFFQARRERGSRASGNFLFRAQREGAFFFRKCVRKC